MPILSNAKHERFAQELARGETADAAYEAAGFKRNRGNAATLKQKQSILDRVAELVEKAEFVERQATQKAIDKLGITKEAVLAELAKIGFSDIRKAIKWNGHLVREEDNPDGGDILVIKTIVSNHVTLIDSEDLDDDTAGAIASVSQNATGGITLKMHDKKGALVDIGKHLGMFVERREVTGKDGGPIQISADELTDDELAAIAASGRRSAGAPKKGKN